tara:strand:+ start:206 stop:1435 length:1230 start_codon:yes stop_codon:yes gene_type:complete
MTNITARSIDNIQISLRKADGTMPKKRILIITRNLPPLVGGMERLNIHMAQELSKYADVKIIGPKGAAAVNPSDIVIFEAPLSPLPLFMVTAFFKALWVALVWRPNLILAGSGLTAPLAWGISKVCSAESAAYLHGFDITVKHTIYQKLWAPVFKRLGYVMVNSSPTQKLALAAGVSESKVAIIYPGVKLPDKPQPPENIQAFRAEYGLVGKKVLLSVGRLTTRKGLREFVELALPAILKIEPNTILLVIGEEPKNSLGANIQTIDSIQNQAKKSGVADSIKFLGVITDKIKLATAYEVADVHVFPVRHIPNDPEGFGMVAIEAAAHGLATVAFSTGGIVDAVSDKKSGYLVEKNNYEELIKHVLKALIEPLDNKEMVDFSKEFTWEVFGRKISQFFSTETKIKTTTKR